jgi:2-amino-4-hydroxy-6-hydroxymethyldihydropteridine pyrophosphokinase
MAKGFIGVGSNLEDRVNNIQNAIKLLKKEKIRILKQSTFIETKPVGGPKQGKFLNGVLEIETKLEPIKLLKTLKAIEKKLGRKRTVKNGPRIIDLDILLYEDKIIKSAKLTIPHPRMHERNFVIKPLKEIAPEIAKLMRLKNANN